MCSWIRITGQGGDTLWQAYKKPNPVVPMAEITAVNLIINRWDLYIRKKEWADVSPSHWWINMKRGFMTDGDNFFTNWMAHPLHGAVLYQTSRTNANSYLEAMPYTMGGVFMWEYLGETEPASNIDIFTTSLGGIYIGEITYRLTDFIWNYPGSRRWRWLRDFSGSLISPVGAFNRFALGRGIPYTPQSLTPVQLTLVGSVPVAWTSHDPAFSGLGPGLAAEVEYGNLFKTETKSFRPFDYFRVDTRTNFSYSPEGKKFTYFNLSSDAVILGTKVTNTASTTDIVSLTQHYDFIHNHVFKLGTIMVTGDWTWQRYAGNTVLDGAARVGVIIFGSGNSEMVKPVYPEIFPNFDRDYIYGQGWVGEIEANVRTRHLGTLSGHMSHFVINSRSQPKGIENLDLARIRYLFPLKSHIILGMQFDSYLRNATYQESTSVPAERRLYKELRLIAGYRL